MNVPLLDDAAPLAGGAGVNDWNSHPDSTASVVVLRPEPAGDDGLGRPPAQRMRGARKLLLRGFGLRAINVRECRISPSTPSAAASADTGRPKGGTR